MRFSDGAVPAGLYGFIILLLNGTVQRRASLLSTIPGINPMRGRRRLRRTVATSEISN